MRCLLDTLNFSKDLACLLNNRVPYRGDMSQMLATSGEDFHAQFVFKQANLLADAGLGSIKTLGSGRHVKAVVGDLPDIPKLL
jgi:hypothetical protein